MEVSRGYDTPAWLRASLKPLSQTSLVATISYAGVDQALILACGLATVWGLKHVRPPGLIFAVYPVLALIAARAMRGLECLVHEASHSNWTRKGTMISGRSRLNDRLADPFAAWPVLSEVAQYAKTHIPHHQKLGSQEDTDLMRWEDLHLRDLNRQKRLPFILGLLQRLTRYVPGWWRAIGVRKRTVLRFVGWHIVWIAIVASLWNPTAAVLTWVFGWLIPLAVVLPILRFVGEIEEHKYWSTMTVATSTFTNIGFLQRLVIHPHGDAFHTVHHLYPSIPFFRVGSVHRRLMNNRSDRFGQIVPIRTGILNEPLAPPA
jgi:fatty acid desaturase